MSTETQYPIEPKVFRPIPVASSKKYEAFQWDESQASRHELEKRGMSFCRCQGRSNEPDCCIFLKIETMFGEREVSKGDWIIWDDRKQFSVHAPAEFEDRYVVQDKGIQAEMLEALQYACRFLRPEDADRDYIKSVIAKAKGQ